MEVFFCYNNNMQLVEFDLLKKVFNENHFRLYIIGGTSRDLLLNHEVNDFDFVTDATPSDMQKFIKDIDLTFAKYGSVHTIANGHKIDVTTLREEGEYDDLRHPSYIKFVNNLEDDSKRRDFTINAIYIDENYKIIDPQNGLKDLKDHLIRMIGDPLKRIKEDPLRIIRAYRFAIVYGFDIEGSLKEAISNNLNLINEIKDAKMQEEFNKIKKSI